MFKSIHLKANVMAINHPLLSFDQYRLLFANDSKRLKHGKIFAFPQSKLTMSRRYFYFPRNLL